jgi:hypothetical protein
MAKYELNIGAWTYQDTIYHRGDVIDVDPDNEMVKSLVEDESLVSEGTLEQRRQDTAKAEQARADWEAEKSAKDAELADQQRRAELGEPNVASEDGPKTQQRQKK